MKSKDDLLVSIIVIKNNNQIFDEFRTNLRLQRKVNFELIVLDNVDGIYKGAREAYNSVLEKINGKVVIFIHPDIRFLDQYALYDILNYKENIENYGVIGIAGCRGIKRDGEKRILSNIFQGTNKQRIGGKIEQPEIVQTVDECLFMIDTELLRKKYFSKVSGWHLYAVEQCLKYNLLGYKNYVVPSRIWHLSSGSSLDFKYVIQLKCFLKKYRKDFSTINTTVRNWKTNFWWRNVFLNYYLVKQFVKGKLLKHR